MFKSRFRLEMKESAQGTKDKPIIAITMGTSRQGYSLAINLAKGNRFRVRAITRNPNSQKAIHLKKLNNVEVVQGDLLDKKSLKDAFKDVYGIFGNTTPTTGWKPFKGSMVHEYELEQGRNLIDAIKSTKEQGKLEHFIFSSICKAKDPLKDIESPKHFSNKWKIEEYLNNEGLFTYSTILRPVSYFENFETNLPKIKISEGIFPCIVNPDKPWQTIAVEDIGQWANAAFNNREYFMGKSLNIAGEDLTGKEMFKIIEKLNADNKLKKVKYTIVPKFLIRLIEHDIATMANWIEETGYGANLMTVKNLAKRFGVNITSLSSWLRKKESLSFNRNLDYSQIKYARN